LRFAHDKLAICQVIKATERSVIDNRVSSQSALDIRTRPDDLEYLISIRQGFLSLILGSHVFIELYSPQRCVHQFGLDHDIPASLLHPTSMTVDLEGAMWCYTHLFRAATNTHC
jgi:hypothetical protein